MLPPYEVIHILVAHDLTPVKTSHDGVSVPELVEVLSEDRRVQETVLTVYVDRIILHWRPREDQLVSCLVSQLVHGLALSCVVGLDSLALVRDDHVRIELLQSLKDPVPPCGLVVDHGHLECLERELFEI